MRVGRWVGVIGVCAVLAVLATGSSAAYADGPPCGVHGPNDCRFDVWGFMDQGGKGGQCGSWYSNLYGIGDVTCGTRYLHGNDGFVGSATFGWRPRPGGGIDIALDVPGREEYLRGVTPSRASAQLTSCVHAPAWAHGSAGAVWTSGDRGTPGTFDGPLYIDVRSRHSGRQDPGDQPEVHIYGWLHSSTQVGASCPR